MIHPTGSFSHMTKPRTSNAARDHSAIPLTVMKHGAVITVLHILITLPDESPLFSTWKTCEFLVRWFVRRALLLQYSHGNTNPSEGVDFFYDQRRGRTPRIPVLFGTPTAAAIKSKEPHRCLHCAGRREFMLQGVTDHLKAKYVSTIY